MKNQKRVSSMSAESWKMIFDWATVIFIALTVVTGSGALITGRIINRRQEIRLRQFDKDLTDAKSDLQSKQAELEREQQKTAKAQTEAAEAQKRLAQALTRFARRSGDRIADFGELVEGFKDKPKMTLEIRYKGDDTEAEWFSRDVDRAFQGIGWTVSARPLKAEEKLGGMPLNGLNGTFVFSQNKKVLDDFLMPFLHAFPFGGQATGTTAPELPDNTLVIVVGVRDKL
jgi:hypothetical protein